ncbi:hypothetical protein K503DRAFT_771360 [Rhizopogon vinicolor AM-OR11-026]|uniref:Uncharacterized protein n=1 Tax=Rhizopogon vinicolor AM-OR11-026 TaxID=1314800 RepID=A0A1B7MYE1_9AGAM|nr:hypothetical protein K503DRAFT_771360 [Rhizopogon vinicolor AM-OR11-026]
MPEQEYIQAQDAGAAPVIRSLRTQKPDPHIDSVPILSTPAEACNSGSAREYDENDVIPYVRVADVQCP